MYVNNCNLCTVQLLHCDLTSNKTEWIHQLKSVLWILISQIKIFWISFFEGQTTGIFQLTLDQDFIAELWINIGHSSTTHRVWQPCKAGIAVWGLLTSITMPKMLWDNEDNLMLDLTSWMYTVWNISYTFCSSLSEKKRKTTAPNVFIPCCTTS